jgi:hypothetical protein
MKADKAKLKEKEAELEKEAAEEEIRKSNLAIEKAKDEIERSNTTEGKKAAIKELKIASADKREASEVADAAELKIKKQ